MLSLRENIPDSKVHGAHMGSTWVLSAPGGPHVGPMNLAVWLEWNLIPGWDGINTAVSFGPFY